MSHILGQELRVKGFSWSVPLSQGVQPSGQKSAHKWQQHNIGNDTEACREGAAKSAPSASTGMATRFRPVDPPEGGSWTVLRKILKFSRGSTLKIVAINNVCQGNCSAHTTSETRLVKGKCATRNVKVHQQLHDPGKLLKLWASTSSAITWKLTRTPSQGGWEDLIRYRSWSTWQRACTPPMLVSFSFTSTTGPECGCKKFSGKVTCWGHWPPKKQIQAQSMLVWFQVLKLSPKLPFLI